MCPSDTGERTLAAAKVAAPEPNSKPAMPARTEIAAVRPTPTDEELAAIVAAIETVWPRPSAGAGGRSQAPTGPSRWRFAGRWWTKPVPTRRDRP